MNKTERSILNGVEVKQHAVVEQAGEGDEQHHHGGERNISPEDQRMNTPKAKVVVATAQPNVESIKKDRERSVGHGRSYRNPKEG